ncbi:MAG: bifunctional DNA-formamidopyrimidine glycosylase/DNA-(apurinic or apyrimidinic site) lyase, partial [Chloroflexota bacterium]
EDLVVHLRMTGRLFLSPAIGPAVAYTRVVMRLDGEHELRFADLRKFGRIQLVKAGERPGGLGKLGPEPLEDGLDVETMARTLGRRKAPIKALLLNQELLAGLGNIYADEALFAASIHPQRPGNSLDAEEWRRLHAAVRQTLTAGILHRGTTFRDYRDGRGNKGSHQDSLAVYRRTGQPCPRCGTPIERIVVGGRSSHYCPRCQRL